MKSVLKFFFISMIVFLPQIVLGQTKNVTNLVKPFNSDNEIKIKGATLDDEKNISITIELNDLSTKWVMAANEMFGGSKTAGEIRTNKILDYLFKSARGVFKKIPTAESIKLYVASFSIERDSYGHKIGEDKTLDGQLVISKETVEKLNWEYINELLHKSNSNQELLEFLDGYKFYTTQFE